MPLHVEAGHAHGMERARPASQVREHELGDHVLAGVSLGGIGNDDAGDGVAAVGFDDGHDLSFLVD
ncbi:hypothetical protein D9M69_678800 [compost metagenome]